MVRLSTLAQWATVIGTGIVIWGIASKFLARIRRRLDREWLTTSESQMLSLFVAALAMCLMVVLLLTIANRQLLQQHTILLKQFNDAVISVENFGRAIEKLLREIAPKVSSNGG